MGKTKNDPAHFDDVLSLLNREAPQVLFVDDNAGHVGRARSRGWNALLFRDEAGVMAALTAFLRGVPAGPGAGAGMPSCSGTRRA
jgi:putative hydrolase of the HAD superfamily